MEVNLMKDTQVNFYPRFQEGQIVLYEGEEAKVIGVEPLLIIKINDRIICGALHGRIEFIKECKLQYLP
jgi:hypothetical protein